MANKEFNNVQLDVKFTKATTLENITSQENISVAFGKLARWFDELGQLSGNASTASRLETKRKINNVEFDGSSNISVFKCLYSTSGAKTVPLNESQSNFDVLLVVITGPRVLWHRVGSGYSFHPIASYPQPNPTGSKTANVINVLLNDQTDKSLTITWSTAEIRGSGTTASTVTTSFDGQILEVYGLKLSSS